MGKMLADRFGRRLSRLALEALPGARRPLVIPAQQSCHRHALGVIEAVVDLLIIAVIHLGAGFLSRPPERTECRQFVSRLHQRFDAHIDDISQDIFALSGIEHRTDEDAPTAATEWCDVKMVANLWDVGLSQTPLLILLKSIVRQ